VNTANFFLTRVPQFPYQPAAANFSALGENISGHFENVTFTVRVNGAKMEADWIGSAGQITIQPALPAEIEPKLMEKEFNNYITKLISGLITEKLVSFSKTEKTFFQIIDDLDSRVNQLNNQADQLLNAARPNIKKATPVDGELNISGKVSFPTAHYTAKLTNLMLTGLENGARYNRVSMVGPNIYEFNFNLGGMSFYANAILDQGENHLKFDYFHRSFIASTTIRYSINNTKLNLIKVSSLVTNAYTPYPAVLDKLPRSVRLDFLSNAHYDAMNKIYGAIDTLVKNVIFSQ